MNIGMMDLPEWERPREKIRLHGVDALSHAEILAVLLGSGTREKSALSLSQTLLASFTKGLAQMEELTLEELMNFPGIGLAKASRILCALELSRRIRAEPSVKLCVSSPAAVYEHMKNKMNHLQREVFICLHLNVKNRIIAEDTVSIGTLNNSLVHPREVFKKAVKNGAAAILVVHNHPSGDPTPSQDDCRVTKRLKEVGELMGIPLLDHIIIAKEGNFSFREEGLL